MVTSPAPARNAPRPLSAAAPDFPDEPATNNTCPNFPLCPSAPRTSGRDANSSGLSQRSAPFPSSSIKSTGEPIGTTSRDPQASALRESNWPTFGAVKVTVRWANSTGPAGASSSDGRPEGVSTERIRAGRGIVALRESRLMSEMARAMRTSRAALDRLLDPRNESVTLRTMTRAAMVLGKRLRLELA